MLNPMSHSWPLINPYLLFTIFDKADAVSFQLISVKYLIHAHNLLSGCLWGLRLGGVSTSVTQSRLLYI